VGFKKNAFPKNGWLNRKSLRKASSSRKCKSADRHKVEKDSVASGGEIGAIESEKASHDLALPLNLNR
jgi:hypothetical protein